MISDDLPFYIALGFAAQLVDRALGMAYGLIIGGALAAPFAGWFSRVLPQPVLMSLVALTVSGLGVYNFVQLGRA